MLTGLILIFLSCTPESCFEETEAFVKASFSLDGTTELQAPDSLSIYGLNMESFKIYDKAPNVTTGLLPLNPETGNSTFIIEINGITDTLVINYTSYPHLVSKECGYTFYHTIIDTPEHTTNIIKGILLNNSNISTINEENIRIFY